jgi:hypothetical protein
MGFRLERIGEKNEGFILLETLGHGDSAPSVQECRESEMADEVQGPYPCPPGEVLGPARI